MPKRFLRIHGVNDLVYDTVYVLEHGPIRKPNDSDSFLMQCDLPIQIGGLGEMAAMSRAIEFDREIGLDTEEIEHVFVDRMLASELNSSSVSIF